MAEGFHNDGSCFAATDRENREGDEEPSAELAAVADGLSRPIASYSPLGATDSGYQTDSPQPRQPPPRHLRATPPPGTFRPVSPQPLQQPHGSSSSSSSGVRHVATQTWQQQQQRRQPLHRGPPSVGFRPASAPLHDLPDNDDDDSDGDAELEEDFDEEVYRSSAAVGGGGSGQPLPDLLQLRRQDTGTTVTMEMARQRSRSVPIMEDSARQERVALLLREIGDQYNEIRMSPMQQSFWPIRGSRDRRISLRAPDDDDNRGGGGGGGGRRDSIGWMPWVANMVRTFSGANIVQDEQPPDSSGDSDDC